MFKDQGGVNCGLEDNFLWSDGPRFKDDRFSREEGRKTPWKH